MTLTRDANLTIIERMKREQEFARLMLSEAAAMLLNGEPDVSLGILNLLVQATVGLEELAELTSTPLDRISHLLSSNGNPDMNLLAAIFKILNMYLCVDIHVRSVDAGSEQDEFEPSIQTRPDAA